MKIGSQSQTLVSLTSLLDASRQQQQELRDDLQNKKLDEENARIATRQSERQELIQQNRNALEKIQADLKERNIQQLNQEYEPTEVTSSDGPSGNEPTNLNFRESIYGNASAIGQPTFEKLGQLVDVKI